LNALANCNSFPHRAPQKSFNSSLSPFTVYKTNLDPDFIIKLVESLRPEDLEDFEVLARRFIQPYPNTYTYTKALSEQIVRKYGSNMKVAIVRPAIITTTMEEPIEGYTDNLYGLNGVVMGAGLGVLRILLINNKLKANIVPADYVVNSILSLAWYTVKEK
jgi:alcohol-forming fatty acyl-CoA reductase